MLVAVGSDAAETDCRRLRACGCAVFGCPGETHAARTAALLDELGRRRFTNILVEGGGRLLGSLFDAGAIDEVHVFIAPKLVGGSAAPGPLGGRGVEDIAAALALGPLTLERLGEDVHLHGRLTPLRSTAGGDYNLR